MKRIVSLISTVLFGLASFPALAAQAQIAGHTKSSIGTHNARYCEIIVVKRHYLKMHASVYNTFGLNDCPAELWSKLNIDAIKKQFDASTVKLNGPRYLMMDYIIAQGQSVVEPVVTIGGMQFKSRANITRNLWDGMVGDKLYTPNEVHRDTVFVFKPGTTVYELVSPEGDTYVMQSYSQLVDPKLSITDLPTLGQRLKLPTGWKYQSRTLTQTLEVKANGTAYVINDDFYDSYQKE